MESSSFIKYFLTVFSARSIPTAENVDSHVPIIFSLHLPNRNNSTTATRTLYLSLLNLFDDTFPPKTDGGL